MAFPIVKTSIAFTDNGKSVRIVIDGSHYGTFAKNKFSFYPNINPGGKSIDLVYVEQEISQEIMFRFDYDQITPAQASLAAAMTYLEGIFFLDQVATGGSPTFANLIVNGLTTLVDLVISGFTRLGNLSPEIKMAFYQTTFPSTVGQSVSVTLTGMDASKILGLMVNGEWSPAGAFMSNNFTWISSYRYHWYTNNATVDPVIFLCLENDSYSMTNKPVNIIVFYTRNTINT